MVAFSTKTVFPGLQIPIMKIRWSSDHLIFIMGFLTPARKNLYIETTPLSVSVSALKKSTKIFEVPRFSAIVGYTPVVVHNMTSSAVVQTRVFKFIGLI